MAFLVSVSAWQYSLSGVTCPSAMMMRMWYALSRFTMLMASLMRGAKEVGPANWTRGVISS